MCRVPEFLPCDNRSIGPINVAYPGVPTSEDSIPCSFTQFSLLYPKMSTPLGSLLIAYPNEDEIFNRNGNGGDVSG